MEKLWFIRDDSSDTIEPIYIRQLIPDEVISAAIQPCWACVLSL